MANAIVESVVVAAIDFGTTYSGYAFAFRDEFEKSSTDAIKANSTWIAGQKNLFSLKTPTCVLLDPNKEFDSFGFEAEDKYSQLCTEDLQHDWMFFERFKMKLHENEKLNREYVITDITGENKMPAKVIFSHGIKYLKKHLMDTFEKQGLSKVITENDITWVLTVPAIWSDSAKQFMREAAENTGIKPNRLIIALEPEAAALYCKTLPVEKLHGAEKLSVFDPETKYMVLDLGGGTVDITIQKVLQNGMLKEVHKASGGAWGGTKVDEAFKTLVSRIVTDKVFNKFSTQSSGEGIDLIREFETKKRTIEDSEKKLVTLRIPLQLSEMFKEEYNGKSLSKEIKESDLNGKLKWTADKLRVDPDVITGLFAATVDNIVKHLKELFKHDKCKGVNTIIMVGGFSDCKIIQNAIKNHFSKKRIIIPEDAGLAIVKGAVLFGFNPKTISSRKTKFTYGIETCRNFRTDDPKDKMINVDGVDKCTQVYDIHIGIDKTVRVGEPLEPKSYYPLYDNQKSINLPVYTSTERGPKYTSDDSCAYLGKLILPLAKGSTKKSEIICRMTFGGTELIVEAKEKATGKGVPATFDFLDH